MTAKDFMQLIIKQLRVISLQSRERFENMLNEEFNTKSSQQLNYSPNPVTLFSTSDEFNDIDNITLFAEGYIISYPQNQRPPELAQLQPPISSYNGYHVSSSSVQTMFYIISTNQIPYIIFKYLATRFSPFNVQNTAQNYCDCCGHYISAIVK